MKKNIFFNLIKSFWFIILIIFIDIGFIFIFWFMLIGAQNDFLQKNEEYNVLAAKRTGILQTNRDSESIKVLSQKLADTFIDKDKFVKFVEFIELTAKNTGNSVNISGVSKENDTENLKIVLDGSYYSFVNFIAQLENSPYLLHVIKTEMNKTSNLEHLKTILDIQIQLL